VPTLADTLADIDRALPGPVLALRDGVTPERVAAALAALHADGRRDDLLRIADAIAWHDPDAFVAAVLPGAEALGVEVRASVWRPTFERADLSIGVADEPGARVVVSTPRGMTALCALDREQRAAIVDLELLSEAQDDAVVPAGTWFDGIHVLDVGRLPVERAAELLLLCPSVTCYCGAATTRDVCDALATTMVRDVFLGGVDDDALGRLAALPRLEQLYISGSQIGRAGLAALGRAARLRELQVSRCGLTDDAVVTLAACRGLERLSVAGNPFGDRAGVALATLDRLVELDLSETSVGDATAIALAALPVLAELDLAETAVDVAGVRALAGAPALERLGLAWHVNADVREAAETLLRDVVRWSDPHHGGGAL